MSEPHQIDLEELIAQIAAEPSPEKQGTDDFRIRVSDHAMRLINMLGVSEAEVIQLVRGTLKS